MVLDDMQRGFGSIRSRLIHECGCDWAFILDADERFFPILPVLECEGTEFYPAVPSPGLKVTTCLDTLNQGLLLKDTIKDPNLMVVRSTRRHWFDFSMTRPTQNWLHRTDHQLRIVRNLPELDYKKSRVMHERLIDSRTGGEPRYAEQSNVTGPFHDHFHMHFRTQFPGKKEANEQNYSRLEKGEEMRA